MRNFTRGLAFGLLFAAAVSLEPASAKDYPTRPIQIVVPFSPGGSTDAVVRVLAAQMEKELKGTVVVVNRPGGAAMIGMHVVSAAAPDGYTLGAANISFGANPSLQKSLPYDTRKDFEPVGMVARVPLVLAVHPSVPAKSVKDFIALAKAKPGSLTYGTAGRGSGSDLSMALFLYLTHLKLVGVPYTGGGPQVAAAVGGYVNALFATIPSALGDFEQGQLRPLGISTLKPDPTLPGVPPIAKVGVPGYEMGDWIGIVAPAKTPKPIVDKLNAAINKSLAVPAVKARIEKLGTQVETGTPKQFASFINKEIARWHDVIKTMGLGPK